MKYYNVNRLIVLLNAVFTVLMFTGIFSVVWEEFYNPIVAFGFFKLGNIGFAVVYGVMLLIFMELFNGLHIGESKAGDLVYSQFLGVLCVDVFAYLVMCLIARDMMNPVYLLLSLPVALIYCIFWNILICRIFTSFSPPRRTIIVYGSRAASSLTMKMSMRYDKFTITEAIGAEERTESILERISCFDAVVICDVPNELRNDIVKYCFENRIVAYITPKISDIILRGAENLHTFDTPLLLCKTFGLKMEFRIFKRLMDLTLSIIALLILSPVILLTGLVVKLYDRGPVFYKQQRLTMNGKIFWLYKFRSMVTNAEKDGVARLASKGDSRITPIGRFIRKTRLDELPQLFNILKGDMAIVGPRPERPEIAAQYEQDMPEFSFRLAAKAGLTGYAQVMGKYNTTPYDKLKMDLMYISQYSILLDIKLIIKTVKILFVPESTEGIDQGLVTAEIPEEFHGDIYSAKEISELIAK